MTSVDHVVVPGAAGPWDGEPGWPRPRHVPPFDGRGASLPATYVQSDPADPVSAHPARLQQVYLEFRCQVCGSPVLDVDVVGWVVEPAGNMGGACCTRCMYLALRACPRMAAGADKDAWRFWAVEEARAYRWQVSDGTADGHVVVDPGRGDRHSRVEFLRHHAAWRRSQASSSVPSG